MNTEVVQIDTEGTRVDPGQVFTERGVWLVADEEFSADTQATDLGVTERTYKAVKRAIAAAVSGDDNISIFDIPNAWNSLNFRVAGITDAGTYTVQIYFGTLGEGNRDSDGTDADCELVNVGQLAWTIGAQESLYSQVAFTSGGTQPIVIGDILSGNTSNATARVRSVTITSGSFAGGDAAGTLQLISRNGTFQSETLDIEDADGSTTSTNVATIAADIVHYELADTLVITANTTWTKAWSSTNPQNDLAAMASIDCINSDVIVIVPTVASADSKLLISGV